MANIKLKDEYKKRVVGFNGSGAPLGERNDLHKLVEIALKSNNTRLLRFFSEYPSLEEIEKSKTDTFIARTESSIPNGASNKSEKREKAQDKSAAATATE